MEPNANENENENTTQKKKRKAKTHLDPPLPHPTSLQSPRIQKTMQMRYSRCDVSRIADVEEPSDAPDEGVECHGGFEWVFVVYEFLGGSGVAFPLIASCASGGSAIGGCCGIGRRGGGRDGVGESESEFGFGDGG